MIRFTLILSLVLMLAMVACAPKEEAPAEETAEATVETTSPVNLIARFDADGDGAMSLEEHKAGSEGWFKQHDLEGDGQFCVNDRNALAEYVFEKWDTDGDGKATLAEVQARFGGDEEIDRTGHECVDKPAFTFANLDNNGDGVVCKVDMLVFTEKRHAMMDADEDGAVTLEEMKAVMMPMYEEIDVDGDKLVSYEELEKHRFQ